MGGTTRPLPPTNTTINYHGTNIELSALPEVEFLADGSLCLSFTNYTGSIVLRPSAAEAAGTAPAVHIISTTSTSGGDGGKRGSNAAKFTPSPAAAGARALTSAAAIPAAATTTGKIATTKGGKGKKGQVEKAKKQNKLQPQHQPLTREDLQELEDEDEDDDLAVPLAQPDEKENQRPPHPSSSSSSSSRPNPRSNTSQKIATSSKKRGKKQRQRDQEDRNEGDTSDGIQKDQNEDDDPFKGIEELLASSSSFPSSSTPTELNNRKPSSSSLSTTSRRTKKARPSSSPSSTSTLSSLPLPPALTHGSTHRPQGAPPQGRWGHTATMVGGNRMVVYGGEGDDVDGKSHTFGDLFVCTLVPVAPTPTADAVAGDKQEQQQMQVRWEKPINCDSIPRTWHSATFLKDKNLLVSFGGERVEMPKLVREEGWKKEALVEVLDDIMVLDTELFLWYPPAISGKPPSARSGHTASLVGGGGEGGAGNEIVIFGGSRGRGWQNNVCVLDVERWHWRTPVIAGVAPPGRSYHSAVVVVGKEEGRKEGGRQGRNLLMGSSPTPAMKEEEGKEGRGVGGGQRTSIVYFGGNNGETCFDKVHVLKVAEGGREGGRDDGWEWFHPEVVGKERPKKRTGHAACLLEDGKSILIQGGWDPQDERSDDTIMYDDAFVLDTESWEWKKVEVEGTKEGGSDEGPGVVVGHTAVLARGGGYRGEEEEVEGEGEEGVRETRVLMFGGQDPGGVRKDDLVVLAV